MKAGRRFGRGLGGILVVAALAFLGLSLVGRAVHAAEPKGAEKYRPLPPADSPQELWLRDCAVCHGADASGTSRGPDLREVGTASVHFTLTTGYMPLDDPRHRMRRREPRYTQAEIDGLTAYVGTMIKGPQYKEVSSDPKLVVKGGELYREHCAACHQFAGTGGILIDDRPAPTLHWATATEVSEAIRTGPGTMPSFSEKTISDEESKAIASFVVDELRDPTDVGGLAVGHTGPFSEGLITWAVALVAILAGCYWIGRRT